MLGSYSTIPLHKLVKFKSRPITKIFEVLCLSCARRREHLTNINATKAVTKWGQKKFRKNFSQVKKIWVENHQAVDFSLSRVKDLKSASHITDTLMTTSITDKLSYERSNSFLIKKK